MELKGAVLIIGSLLWEDGHSCNKKKGEQRKKWRNENLIVSKRKLVDLPIRYGRKSSSRCNTYTMIFYNCIVKPNSKGFCVPLKREVTVDGLMNQAKLMADAEGIIKDGYNKLANRWGAVALLLNPEKSGFDKIKKRWTKTYSLISEFDFKKFHKVIDNNGFLKIKWIHAFDKFDFILASLTSPERKRLPSALEIAKAIVKSGYYEYFENNISSGITTFQDKAIKSKIENLRKLSKAVRKDLNKVNK